MLYTYRGEISVTEAQNILWEAVMYDDPSLIEMSLACGGSVQYTYKENLTVLHYAAEMGRTQIIQILIEQYGANVEAEDTNGRTPLVYAVYYQQIEALKKLALLGAKKLVWIQPNLNPVHYAAMTGNITLLRVLVEELGLSPTSQNETGFTPLHIATIEGKSDCVLMLVRQFQVSLEQTDIYGRTAMHFAASRDEPKVLKLLHSLGANPEAKDSLGRTPLHNAAIYGKAPCMRELIAVLHVNSQTLDYQGHTPLHAAALFRQTLSVDVLVNEFGLVPIELKQSLLLVSLMHAYMTSMQEINRLLIYQTLAYNEDVERFRTLFFTPQTETSTSFDNAGNYNTAHDDSSDNEEDSKKSDSKKRLK